VADGVGDEIILGFVIRHDALRASTEVDENGGRHLTRLPGWKQIPSESEAGFQLVLFQARLSTWSGRNFWNQTLSSPLHGGEHV